VRGLLGIIACCALASVANAQVELKNDGFETGDQAGFQAGFVTGEIGASRFVAPAAGTTLLKVLFLFGGSIETKNVIVRVWDDSAGTDAPGAELFNGEFQLTGADAAFQVSDVSAQNIVLPAQFRVGVEFQHSGLPSIARDDDGTIAATRNFIYADLGGGNRVWFQSMTLGVTGDWIIRAEVGTGTGPGPMVDAGVTVDAAVTGGACSGNAQCAVGEYCDLAVMTCTFDCRTNADCGGNTCNSLGQCVGLDGGGGCGCRAPRGNAASLVLAALVLLVLVRRR
jgi:hypothetical protein